MSYQIVKGGLQSSLNYTWNDADVLGRGATADVFLGRHKLNGDVFAVKQFRPGIYSHGNEAELRELNLLRKLDHENVIKLYDIEHQSLSGCVVIIMEYCEGGSLHALLDQPQYSYGLPEDQLLLVLQNVVCGIQYLRSLGIIHRDIKPGNIMRCFKPDGKVSYKLTDFGAARELEEEQNFTSMYGTEEYLYPPVYETAVLRLPTGQTFDSKVDLWSLGVTFYHSATGKLPFIPYGGRNNRETMFKIISQKESGVISGIQHDINGPIHWSRELPSTCLLSGGLKIMLVPLLAGLMETNQHKMIKHNKLFEIIDNICGRILFHVFHYALCVNLSIYVNKKESFSVLQDSIAEQTEIPASNQILLQHGRQFQYDIDVTAPIETYPLNIIKTQLYVYSCNITESHSVKLPEIMPFPLFTSNYNDYNQDCKLAFQCCARSNVIKQVVSTLLIQQKCLVEGEQFLRMYIQSKSMLIHEAILGVDKILQESRKRMDTFYRLLQTISNILHRLYCPSQELEDIINDNKLLPVHERAEERLEQIKTYKGSILQTLEDQQQKVSRWFAVCDENKCLDAVTHYHESINTMLGRFRRDKNARAQMTSHDEKVHSFEREKLEKICNRVIKLINDHCFSNLQIMYSQASTYLASLVKNNSRILKINTNIDNVVECQHLLSVRLDKVVEKAQEVLSRVNEKSLETVGRNIGSSISNIQATPQPLDPGYTSFNPQHPISTNPTEITQTISELKQDALEMENLVQTSTDILSRFFFEDPLFSDGSIGNKHKM